MSQENVEIMRRFYAAWLRRDSSELGTLDPKIELHPDPEHKWVGIKSVYRGPDGVGEYMKLCTRPLRTTSPRSRD